MKVFLHFYSDEKFDVVFLQEVWYEKDYDILSACMKNNYFISDYDGATCGGVDKVLSIAIFN